MTLNGENSVVEGSRPQTMKSLKLGPKMAVRLGNVLYWIGCICAGLIFAAGAGVWYTEGHARSDGVHLSGICCCDCGLGDWTSVPLCPLRDLAPA